MTLRTSKVVSLTATFILKCHYTSRKQSDSFEAMVLLPRVFLTDNISHCLSSTTNRQLEDANVNVCVPWASLVINVNKRKPPNLRPQQRLLLQQQLEDAYSIIASSTIACCLWPFTHQRLLLQRKLVILKCHQTSLKWSNSFEIWWLLPRVSLTRECSFSITNNQLEHANLDVCVPWASSAISVN